MEDRMLWMLKIETHIVFSHTIINTNGPVVDVKAWLLYKIKCSIFF